MAALDRDGRGRYIEGLGDDQTNGIVCLTVGWGGHHPYLNLVTHALQLVTATAGGDPNGQLATILAQPERPLG